jgi:glucokinase
MKSYLGIEIGGTKLQLAVGDESGIVRERRRLTVEAGSEAPDIRKQIESALPELLTQFSPVAVGKIARSHQIEGWSGFDLAGWVRGLTNLPVFVDNDANVGALGEATHGAGRGHDPVFYVTLGSGVGGGLVVGGSIYHGASPGESEIGHIRLDRGGTTIESRCSGWAVDRKVKECIKRNLTSPLAKLARGAAGGEARFLTAAIAEGDQNAKPILNNTASDLAFGLSHVVHLFHPAIITLGGGLAGIGEPLRAAVQGALAGFIMEVFRPGPQIALASLGEDAVPAGAIELARLRSAVA